MTKNLLESKPNLHESKICSQVVAPRWQFVIIRRGYLKLPVKNIVVRLQLMNRGAPNVT